MNLQECLQDLSYGELSNLSWANSGNGTIRNDKIPTVVGYINEGLLRLYTRFKLQKDFCWIECYENITQYHLSSKHAYMNEDSTEKKYIRDTPEHLFTDNVIKILGVYSSTGNEALPLNNHGERWSVYTPVFDVLEVPYPYDGLELSVDYQASHPVLDFSKNPEQEINLSPALYTALKQYVAYKIHSNMNTQEAVANANKYFQQYQLILQDVVAQDSISESYSQTNDRFYLNGWR